MKKSHFVPWLGGLAKGKYRGLPPDELYLAILQDALEGTTGYSYTEAGWELAAIKP